jgi:hypothetical protein
MAEYIRESDSSSATTLVVSVIVVLIIALAFYFGFVRGDRSAVGGPDAGTNIEFNAGGALDADAAGADVDMDAPQYSS